MRFLTGLLAFIGLLVAATAVDRARATGFASYYAIINAGGATIKGSGVSSSAKTALGIYDVTFGRDVADCALIGTLRGGAAGFVAARNKVGAPKAVTVTTFLRTGARTDLSFYLLVHCNT